MWICRLGFAAYGDSRSSEQLRSESDELLETAAKLIPQRKHLRRRPRNPTQRERLGSRNIKSPGPHCGHFAQAGWPQSHAISASLEPASLHSWLQYFSPSGGTQTHGRWAHFVELLLVIFNSFQFSRFRDGPSKLISPRWSIPSLIHRWDSIPSLCCTAKWGVLPKEAQSIRQVLRASCDYPLTQSLLGRLGCRNIDKGCVALK